MTIIENSITNMCFCTLRYVLITFYVAPEKLRLCDHVAKHVSLVC